MWPFKVVIVLAVGINDKRGTQKEQCIGLERNFKLLGTHSKIDSRLF